MDKTRLEKVRKWEQKKSTSTAPPPSAPPPPTSAPQKPAKSGARRNRFALDAEEGADQPAAAKRAKVDEAEGSEMDPLDAYMLGVEAEVRRVEEAARGAEGTAASAAAAMDVNDGEEKESLFRVRRKGSDDGSSDGSGSDSEHNAYHAYLKDQQAARNKKDLKPVDHSKVEYPPIFKALYTPARDIDRMTEEEVEEYMASLGNIKVKGKKWPRPIKTWAQAGLPQAVISTLKEVLRFDHPTPIQACALPLLLSGRDCIGIAKTGSGKTLAFGLPLIRHVMAQPPRAPDEGPIGLIMSPTRELTVQIYSDLKKFTKALGIRLVAAYGGAPIKDQIADLRRGAEIVVCTPGRMIELLTVNSGRVSNLRRVTMCVLDEADRMFDLGFEPQIMKIMDNARPDKQVVLFSATFPTALERIAKTRLQNPVELMIGGRSVVCNDVTQVVEVMDENAKLAKLLALLGQWDQESSSVLIFCDTQNRVDSLFSNLIKRGYPCLTLHGGMDQGDRDSTLSDFKNGVCKLLLATSIAARGLDIKDLSLVINYSCPNHYEDYVHRCGRTGRAGRKGTAVTFVLPSDYPNAPEIAHALEASGAVVPEALKALVEKAEVEIKEGKMHKSSGFGGKGFKFDASENAATEDRKKAEKASYGIVDDNAATDKADAAALAAALDLDDDYRANSFNDNNGSNNTNNSNNEGGGGGGGGIMVIEAGSTRPVPSAAGGGSVGAAGGGGGAPKLTKAQEIALRFSGQLSASGSAGSAASGVAVVNPGAAAIGSVSALGLAEGITRQETGKRHFLAEIEINDYPQHARWVVTRKDALADLIEFSRTAITIRGDYYAPGAPVKEGGRKLYLAIEGDNEDMVRHARIEVKKKIEEAAIKATAISAQQAAQRQPGKYSVV